MAGPGTVLASASEAGVSPVGSTNFFAREICELSLGQIGDYSPKDEGAEQFSMQRALKHLDMIISELAGSDLNWWLMEETYRFSWPADTRTERLADVMRDAYPTQGIIMPWKAQLLDEDGRLVDELPIVRRDVYDSVTDKDDVGQPELLYFDRLAMEATVSVYRVPDVDTWQIDLTAQTYARSVLGTQSQTDQAGNLQTGFAPEWRRYLVNQLAADIGNGPVRRVALATVKDWRAVAEDCLGKLQAWSNREKKSTPSRTAPWGR